MGTNASAIDDMKEVFKGHAACTYEHHEPNCPRIITVLLISEPTGQGNGNKKTIIEGFASFFVETVVSQGKDKYISGNYIKTFTEGEINVDDNKFHNTLGVRLTE